MNKFWFWFTKKIFESKAMKIHKDNFRDEIIKILGVVPDHNMAEKMASLEL